MPSGIEAGDLSLVRKRSIRCRNVVKLSKTGGQKEAAAADGQKIFDQPGGFLLVYLLLILGIDNAFELQRIVGTDPYPG